MFKQRLILFLLLLYPLKSFLIFLAYFFWLVIWIQIGETLFCFCNILCQYRVNIVILLLFLWLNIFLPFLFEKLVQLLLLGWWQLISILKELHKLLSWEAIAILIWTLNFILLLIVLLILNLLVGHILFTSVIRICYIITLVRILVRHSQFSRLCNILRLALLFLKWHFINQLHIFVILVLVLDHSLLKL